MIDNWLYTNGFAHAYERKLPIEQDVYSDFFIKEGNVYIEFWGMESDEKYSARKKVKQEAYSENDFNLIELNDNDLNNLDDILPRKLLQYGLRINWPSKIDWVAYERADCKPINTGIVNLWV